MLMRKFDGFDQPKLILDEKLNFTKKNVIDLVKNKSLKSKIKHLQQK